MATTVFHDDPRHQESLARRYGWELLLYVMFAALTVLAIVMVQ